MMGMIAFQFEEPLRNSIDEYPQPFRQGFTFTFDNGYRLSIQGGAHNYCDDTDPPACGFRANAEVAVIAPDGSWATRNCAQWAFGVEDPYDDVLYRVTPDDLAQLMWYVANIKGG